MPPRKRRSCKDDPAHANRAAPHPGPRCATCHRAVRRGRRDASWAAYILRTYNLAAELYWAVYHKQNDRCSICQRATGKTKKLAVDHDHLCCPEVPTCGQCTRGLLCGTCNKILGHLRDDPAAFERAAEYLRNPPAREIIQCEAFSASTTRPS